MVAQGPTRCSASPTTRPWLLQVFRDLSLGALPLSTLSIGLTVGVEF